MPVIWDTCVCTACARYRRGVHSGSSLNVYGSALPWWLDASSARSRCAGLRPALALCECTPRCPCAPTPPIRSSLPWQCRSARGLERWDEMILPWASLPPDRWGVGAPWRGTRSHWRVPKCTARAVFACLRARRRCPCGAGKFCQDGACRFFEKDAAGCARLSNGGGQVRGT